MAEFVILLNGHPKSWGTSDQEKSAVMSAFGDWVNGLDEKKHYKDCARLAHKMARVTGAKGEPSIDGPFTETKELFSGLIRIEAEDFEQALSLAKTCPMLQKGVDLIVVPLWS
jgi:hypothetical protein